MTVLKKHYALFFTLVIACGCGGNSNDPRPGEDGKDREIILTHWADNIIIPSYNNFKVKFDAMNVKGKAFVNSPGVNALTEFRSAWQDAYIEWQKVELFEFGVADKYTLRSFFNIYPTNVAGINENINNPGTNLDLPTSYARQGFPALDYLINGVGEGDDAIVSFYTDAMDGAKRIAYLNTILTRMETLLNNVITEWEESYRDTFISKTSLDIGSSMGSAVNAYVLHYERYIRSGKIGIPSGATIISGGVAHPETIEALYKSDISLALAKTAHQAAVDFFDGRDVATGEEGPGFKTYLDALEAKDPSTGTLLSSAISEQFALVNTKLNELVPDLYEQVQLDKQSMVDVYTEMQKAVRMLKVDMTSAMSISITYTDNDGD